MKASRRKYCLRLPVLGSMGASGSGLSSWASKRDCHIFRVASSSGVGGGIGLRFGGEKDTVGFGASLFETELMLQLFALCRVLLPVARVLDLVGFRLRHAFDAAFGVTIGFAAADGSAFGVRAVQLTDGVFEYSSCHVVWVLIRQTWRIHYTLFAVAV